MLSIFKGNVHRLFKRSKGRGVEWEDIKYRLDIYGAN